MKNQTCFRLTAAPVTLLAFIPHLRNGALARQRLSHTRERQQWHLGSRSHPRTRPVKIFDQCALALIPRPRTLPSDQPHRLNSEPEHGPEGNQKSADTPIAASTQVDTDADCALRARQGDRAAMEVLVVRHQAAVSRLLWRFVRSQADLDDLVQETFLRMVRGLPGWRAEQPFLHWLLRIATNTGRDYFRRQTVRRRWTVEPTASTEDTLEPEAIDPAPDPAARAAANEVKTMLGQLPPDERTLLTLHHLEGWALADIAAQFGWTLTATKLRAWRARRRLRALFQNKKFS